MTVDSWLSTFTETFDGSGFRIAEARVAAEFMRRYGAPAGSFVEGRRRGDQELVILDLLTAAPQRPVYPIRPAERIGILFARENAQPLVTMLRDDFPDTEHQQLVPEGMSAAICIDDRQWAEARLTWTPAELIERVLTWFRRAGRGELHDARQPLDPVLIGSQLSFFIARSVLDAGIPQDLIAEHDPGDGTILRVRPAQQDKLRSAEPFSIVTYKVPGESMKRLTFAPSTLVSLGAMLAERGIDLFADLRTRLGGWIAEGPAAAWRLNGLLPSLLKCQSYRHGGYSRTGLTTGPSSRRTARAISP